MPIGLVANLLDNDGDEGCKGAAEWWPLGVQGPRGQWADGLGLYVGGHQECHRGGGPRGWGLGDGGGAAGWLPGRSPGGSPGGGLEGRPEGQVGYR